MPYPVTHPGLTHACSLLSRLRQQAAQIVAFAFIGAAAACCPAAQLRATQPAKQREQAAGQARLETTAASVGIQPMSDGEIQARIQRILTASEWFERVHVEVREGIVFLEGTADSEVSRQWAADMSRRVEDVVAVVNNMALSHAMSFDVDRSVRHVSQSLRQLWRDFLARLPLIFVGGLILVITTGVDHLAAFIVRRSSRQARLRSSLQDLMVQLSTFVTWVVGLMIAAIVVFPGMTPAKLLTVLGLGSVALGFAFKDIFENFFAGILILWRFPFDKGDFIQCSGLSGQVEDITIRMTQIRRVDGELVVVPNAVLFKNPVDVLTSLPLRRTSITCGVAYREDVGRCRELIEQAVRDCPTVALEKPVEVFAEELASSSINFSVTWWTGSAPLEIRRSRDEVIEAIKAALDAADVEIPFPQRTIHFQTPLVTRANGHTNAQADAAETGVSAAPSF